MTVRKPKVAVLFGGRSNEHPISCISAKAVLNHLDRDEFQVTAVGITKEGRWVLFPSPPELTSVAPDGLPEVTAPPDEPPPPRDPHRRPAQLLDTVTALDCDVVFPVLHGAFGEDGTLQGLLEMASLPYVGAGVLASAAGMDKEFTRKLLVAEGLPVTGAIVLRPGMKTLAADQRDSLGLPVFVKPARGGSSIGITRVTDWAHLDSAISTAREHDPKVIVEAAVAGREIECGVLEYPDGTVRASVPAEISVGQTADFYDFDAKYLTDSCDFAIPAELDQKTTDQLRTMAIDAFHALSGQGLARVDFFVGDGGQLTINEINTMPGFTPISLYPRMWEHTGVTYPELLSVLVRTALARGTGLR